MGLRFYQRVIILWLLMEVMKFLVQTRETELCTALQAVWASYLYHTDFFRGRKSFPHLPPKLPRLVPMKQTDKRQINEKKHPNLIMCMGVQQMTLKWPDVGSVTLSWTGQRKKSWGFFKGRVKLGKMSGGNTWQTRVV
jgi:hypothetical protein